MIQQQKDQFTADLTAKVWDIFDKGSVFYDKIARTISEHVNQYLPQTGEGWISCSKRLPAKDELVIWLYKDGSMNIGSGRPDMNSLYTLVTHWQPLPAPPIDQQKKEEV